MLDILSLLASLISQLHSRSTDSLALVSFRTFLPCKLQTEQCFHRHHLVHHKFWIPKELELMRCLLPRRLCHLQLSRKLISLVHVEASQLGSSHMSNFLTISQTFLENKECTTRIQCCWCTFLLDIVPEICRCLRT